MLNRHRTHGQKSLGQVGKKSKIALVLKGPTAKPNVAANDNAAGSTATRVRELQRVLAIGAAVLPVAKGGKMPAIAGGVYAATNNMKTLAPIFKANPDLNYGIATGAPSGIFVLDIDGQDGKEAFAGLVKEHGALPKTVRVLTPHGEHRYFEAPGCAIPNSVGRIGPGIDIRGDGGYSVGPGSATPDGVYRYADKRSLDDIEIAQAPPWLLNLIGRKKSIVELDIVSPTAIDAANLPRAKAYAGAVLKRECERLLKARRPISATTR
jgi:hypothetical protein